MQGACNRDPGPFTWWQYHRLFLGWKRERWRMVAELCAAAANANPFRTKPAVPWDYSWLLPRPKRYIPPAAYSGMLVGAKLGLRTPNLPKPD